MSDISSTSISSLNGALSDLTKQLREDQEKAAADAAEKDVYVFEKRTADRVTDTLQFSRDIGVLVKDNSRLNVITNFQPEEQADYFRFRVAKGGEIRLNSISQLDFQSDVPDDKPTGLTISGGTVSRYAQDETVVAKLGAEDPDEGDTFTYALVNEQGTAFPNKNFEIVDDEIRVKKGNELLTTEDAFHSVRVRVTDSGGNTYFQDVSLRVSNSLNVEAPEDLESDEPVDFRIQLFTRNGRLVADNEGTRDDLKEAFAALKDGTFEADAGEYVVKVSRASQDRGDEEIQYAIQLTQGDYKNDFDTIEQPFKPGSLPEAAVLPAATTELLDGLNSALSFIGSLPPIGQSGSEKLFGALTDILA